MIAPFKASANLSKILAHPARLAILTVLREGEQCVCHIEAMLKLRQAYISQHLMVLREAGIVADRRDGWNMYYRVIQPEIFAVVDALFALAGLPETIPHVHSPAGTPPAGQGQEACPCPKCHPTDEVIPFDSAIASSSQ